MNLIKILIVCKCYFTILGMPSKKKLHMEGKVPFWGGGGKKKGPNFPSKRAKKVGN